MQVEVDESDLLVMKKMGISTAEQIQFRTPSNQDPGEFARVCIFPYAAYGNEQNTESIEVFCREAIGENMHLSERKKSGAAASVRRISEAARVMAKRDVEKLTEEHQEGDTPKKLNLIIVGAMERKA